MKVVVLHLSFESLRVKRIVCLSPARTNRSSILESGTWNAEVWWIRFTSSGRSISSGLGSVWGTLFKTPCQAEVGVACEGLEVGCPSVRVFTGWVCVADAVAGFFAPPRLLLRRLGREGCPDALGGLWVPLGFFDSGISISLLRSSVKVLGYSVSCLPHELSLNHRNEVHMETGLLEYAEYS